MDIKLRNLKLSDLERYKMMKHPSREFHKFNGPYFKKSTEKELEAEINKYRKILKNNKDAIVLKNKKVIVSSFSDEIIGEVNWYWRSEETFWLEVGVVIFDEKYWGRAIGYKALILWIDEIFKRNQKLVRIGITTWSGNIGMIKLAEKLNMKREAVYRKARIVNGEYFDSISYGLLKGEFYDFLKNVDN